MHDLSVSSWLQWMAMARGQQRPALEAWLAALPDETPDEAWNMAFGPDSLFDAWTRTSMVQAIYGANARLLAEQLGGRAGWRAVEIGGGDGRLWEHVQVGAGTLYVIDPAAEAAERVRARVPDHIEVIGVQALVQDTLGQPWWSQLDAVVCSLTLHHVAGADAAERAIHGLPGPGKLEVLQRIRESLAPGGVLLVNEADIHCDVQIPAGPLLAERLMDSYVRRCAGAMLHEIQSHPDASDDLRARWGSIVRHWCLEQVRYADVPLAQRDVYELDVPRWLALFERAGLSVRERGFTDSAMLFHRYVLTSASDRPA